MSGYLLAILCFFGAFIASGIRAVDFKIHLQQLGGSVKIPGIDGNLLIFISGFESGGVDEAGPGAVRRELDAVDDDGFALRFLSGKNFFYVDYAAGANRFDRFHFNGAATGMNRKFQVGWFYRDLFAGKLLFDGFDDPGELFLFIFGNSGHGLTGVFFDSLSEFFTAFRIISVFFPDIIRQIGEVKPFENVASIRIYIADIDAVRIDAFDNGILISVAGARGDGLRKFFGRGYS